jgi:hypothetical protein
MKSAQLLVGCRLFRVRTGAYPGGLRELCQVLPEFFSAPLRDPFSGAVMGYTRRFKPCPPWLVHPP